MRKQRETTNGNWLLSLIEKFPKNVQGQTQRLLDQYGQLTETIKELQEPGADAGSLAEVKILEEQMDKVSEQLASIVNEVVNEHPHLQAERRAFIRALESTRTE